MPAAHSTLRKAAGFEASPEPAVGDDTGAIHVRIRGLARREAGLRLMRGHLARTLLARQSWTPLGFVRLSDFTRERLGIAARTLEEEAQVVRALEWLPWITIAFVDATLSWTQVRLLTSVARTTDEREWISTAASMDTRTLAGKVRERLQHATAAAPSGDNDDEEVDATVEFCVRVTRGGRRLWR